MAAEAFRKPPGAYAVPMNDHKTYPLPQIVLVATVAMVAAVWGITGIAREAEALGPQVGDMVAFDNGHRSPFASTARLTAERPNQPACVLDEIGRAHV